jgi:site-specific DNA recombinase
MLAARDVSGERKRTHPHYLKGSLYCGECGSRMSYALAKGRYACFYCLNQKKGNGCTQPYVDVTVLEAAVEDLYTTIEISPEWVAQLKTRLEVELAARWSSDITEKKALTKAVDDLTGQQKLMLAYYAEAVPLEMLKAEQTRLSAEVMLCEERLGQLNAPSSRRARSLIWRSSSRATAIALT